MSSRFGVVVAFWGALLTLTSTVAVLGFDSDTATWALLGGAALLALASGLLMFLTNAGATAPPGNGGPLEYVTTASPATFWCVLAIAFLGLGAVLGLWLVWIGVGMAVIGVGWITREVRGERRILRAAAEGSERAGERG